MQTKSRETMTQKKTGFRGKDAKAAEAPTLL